MKFRNEDEMDVLPEIFSQSNVSELYPQLTDSRCPEIKELEVTADSNIAEPISETNM